MYQKKKVAQMQSTVENTVIQSSKHFDHSIIKLKNPNYTKIEKAKKLEEVQPKHKLSINIKDFTVKHSHTNE
jgi:hypothetical protein